MCSFLWKSHCFWFCVLHIHVLMFMLNYYVFINISTCINLCIYLYIFMYLSSHLFWEKAMAPHSCLENPMDGGAWKAAVHGVARSRTRLSGFTFTFHFSLSCTGEGNGNPLRCSCLENPREGSLVGCHLWGRTESDMTEAT